MDCERILVVDDEDAVRDMIVTTLTSAGYRCTPAASGREALQALESNQEFELMLSDLMMPGMDGSALLERSKERFPDMPVVMVTAVSDTEVALAAIRNGAYDYLLKPFKLEQLVNIVRRALENRRLKLDNRTYQLNLEALVTARTEQLRETLNHLKRANDELERANDELERANDELERSYDVTLEALGDALDLKDAETEGHSKRVTAFTIAIARALGLPKEQIDVIARGAFLHDIGKMAIPDAILRKAGPLDEEERKLMREHCQRGYQILSKISFLVDAAEIVYAHQERYDGSGYPRGLKGEEIPLGARIFAIADTLDAITSDRPYRPAQSLPAAKEEILRWSGRQFDPAIVAVFLAMPDQMWEDLRREINSHSFRIPYPQPRLAGAHPAAEAAATRH